MRTVLLNLGLYQAGWFACVLGGAHGFPRLGACIGLVLLLIHLFLCRERGKELVTVLLIGLIGAVLDSVQIFFGVFVFLSGYWSPWAAPLWLSVMWLQFATLFHFSLDWLSGRYLLSAFLGALGGPAAFLTGEKLGAAVFPHGPFYSLSLIASVWALVLPVSVWIADRFRPVQKEYRIFK